MSFTCEFHGLEESQLPCIFLKRLYLVSFEFGTCIMLSKHMVLPRNFSVIVVWLYNVHSLYNTLQYSQQDQQHLSTQPGHTNWRRHEFKLEEYVLLSKKKLHFPRCGSHYSKYTLKASLQLLSGVQGLTTWSLSSLKVGSSTIPKPNFIASLSLIRHLLHLSLQSESFQLWETKYIH